MSKLVVLASDDAEDSGLLYWQEENDDTQHYVVPDDIVDLSFKVRCASLPLDHAYGLSAVLHDALPWLEEEDRAGIHLIHGAESGNGWMRPQGPQDILYLSRRTRMTLRLPSARAEEAKVLQGKTLDVAGNALTLGEASVRPLSMIGTVFSRYVIAEEIENEAAFLDEAARMLRQELGIHVKKMLSGRMQNLAFPEGDIRTRSLMIDGLDMSESIKLQQQGLGPGRKVGCGLFLPHKGIEAVSKTQGE